MHRLYRQIYLTIVASLLLVVLFGGMLWRFAPHPSPGEQGFELVGEIVAPVLAPADADDATQQRTLDRIHGRLKFDLALCGIASLAQIGGVASAPILAAAYRPALVPVAVLLALLGYILGTGVGLVMAPLLTSLAPAGGG